MRCPDAIGGQIEVMATDDVRADPACAAITFEAVIYDGTRPPRRLPAVIWIESDKANPARSQAMIADILGWLQKQYPQVSIAKQRRFSSIALVLIGVSILIVVLICDRAQLLRALLCSSSASDAARPVLSAGHVGIGDIAPTEIANPSLAKKYRGTYYPVDTRVRDNGFSLLELLVVLALISALIAILLPAIARSRATSQQVHCLSNLRQIGLGIENYAAAHKNVPPGWTGRVTQLGHNSWIDSIQICTGQAGLRAFSCPARPSPCFPYFMSARWQYLNGRSALRFSDIRNTSEFVLSGDCNRAEWFPAPVGNLPADEDDLDKDDAEVECLSFRDQPLGISTHMGGNCVLFADSHAAVVPRFSGQNVTFSPKRRSVSWAEISSDNDATTEPSTP